jgi:hypothetical protein
MNSFQAGRGCGLQGCCAGHFGGGGCVGRGGC